MSSAHDGSKQTKPPATAGAYTLAEILSQPQCWDACLKLLEESGGIKQAAEQFVGTEDWLFIGCGSSYYVALAAAASWTALTHARARAIPASEVLLFPDLLLAGSNRSTAVLISRSGLTSEVLQAAELLQTRGVRSIAITCAAAPKLQAMATTTIALLPADEQSTVMTRSFTSMLLALQYLGAAVAGEQSFRDALSRLPKAAEVFLRSLPKRVREFAADYEFTDYVCLGQGPFFGLARESALKMTEMSVSYARCFHTLEFRHGPKSVISPQTLLIFLLSESGYATECDVLEEMRSLGGATVAIANRADAKARAASTFMVELRLDLPELARLVPYIMVPQLLGLYTGLKKKLDPDHPRNLSRVVLLERESSRGKPEHATL